jgi:DNA-binding LacI/PurR family transcriptional regulator
MCNKHSAISFGESMKPSRRRPVKAFDRLDRPASLTSRVEQLLRQAIKEGQFVGGRLPTEIELAEQFGVSRETVRLAAHNLQREGLLFKIRRKGTYLRPPSLPERIETQAPGILGYLQAGYAAGPRQEEAVSRQVNALMLQGALEEASSLDFRLAVRHARHDRIGEALQDLRREQHLRGAIFAHYGESKLLRRVQGLGLPAVLLDHDLQLAAISSVRDDSFEAGRLAVRHLAGLRHRRIAFVNWQHEDLNPWRLEGYRQGLRDAGLPRRRAWELAVELTPAGATTAVRQFLALTPRPTALYCFNNSLAGLVIAEVCRRGFKVPGDISIMGGGGEDVTGLTCHQADWHEMGRMAVQVIERALSASGAVAPEHCLCAHELRLGQTTAGLG